MSMQGKRPTADNLGNKKRGCDLDVMVDTLCPLDTPRSLSISVYILVCSRRVLAPKTLFHYVNLRS